MEIGSRSPDYRANEMCVKNDFKIDKIFGLTMNHTNTRTYYKSEVVWRFKKYSNKHKRMQFSLHRAKNKK